MSSTRGGLAETWAMARVKRARQAETAKPEPNVARAVILPDSFL